MKLTKIVATIGPASDSEEAIKNLILNGVNVFRFNFKHNTIEWHDERIKRVNKVAAEMQTSIGTLIDLQGPEIRINMPYDEMELKIGESLLFGEESLKKEEKGFSISHPDIIVHLEEGQKLIADDGAFTFFVEKKGNRTYLRSGSDGVLKHRKSLNIPGADFPFPVLIDRDFEGLQLAERNEVDYVALSFVRSTDDLQVVKKEMKKYGFSASIVGKIETQKALNDIDGIIEESDAIMIARGDLGVELPVEQVPYYQKILIKKCLEKGKPVITATQMLQSMIANPYPTRAEVSDVANACFDLTDAVMLSGETASGKYPLETVIMMSKTIQFNESKFDFDTRIKNKFPSETIPEMICDSAYNLYLQLKAQKKDIAGFLIFTQTGSTAKLISRYRPMIPIFAFAPEKEICDNLTLYYGITPFIFKELHSRSEVNKNDVLKMVTFLHENGQVKKDEKLIILHGDYWAQEGGTSTVKIVTV